MASYAVLKGDITPVLVGSAKKDIGIHTMLSMLIEYLPNPNELLAKPLLDELIAGFRNDYDFIILDTAPLGVVSDSFLLNRLADVNLYIVRADYTPKRYVEEAAKHFKDNKLSNMYFVLNSVNLNTIAYRYGYGKKYGIRS